MLIWGERSSVHQCVLIFFTILPGTYYFGCTHVPSLLTFNVYLFMTMTIQGKKQFLSLWLIVIHVVPRALLST